MNFKRPIDMYLELAMKMALTPAEAVALPTVIEVAAVKVGLSKNNMLQSALRNPELCQYLAGVCRETIAKTEVK